LYSMFIICGRGNRAPTLTKKYRTQNTGRE
jgi:hypothetical protein